MTPFSLSTTQHVEEAREMRRRGPNWNTGRRATAGRLRQVAVFVLLAAGCSSCSQKPSPTDQPAADESNGDQLPGMNASQADEVQQRRPAGRAERVGGGSRRRFGYASEHPTTSFASPCSPRLYDRMRRDIQRMRYRQLPDDSATLHRARFRVLELRRRAYGECAKLRPDLHLISARISEQLDGVKRVWW